MTPEMRAALEQMAAEAGMDPNEMLRMMSTANPEMVREISCMSRQPSDVSSGRAEGNAKFKAGDLAGAVAAYEACLTDPDEDRLPVLSNLGLCYLKMSDRTAAVARLSEALALTPSLFASPKLAAKAAARLYEAHGTTDSMARRLALYDLRFFMRRAGGVTGLPPLPAPTDEQAVLRAIVTMVNAPPSTHGLATVRTAMLGVPADASDQHGGCLLVVATEIACKSTGRGVRSFGCELLALMLEGGTPPDVRNSDNGATPLMTAANNGRADLCELLLDAGASVSASDQRGFQPLHCACAGMEDMVGREQEFEAVFALLLARGAPPSQANGDGMTPLMYCGQRLHGPLATSTRTAEMLLDYGADLTTRTNCKPLHGYSAVDFALRLDGSQSPLMALLRQVAQVRGAETRSWLSEAEKIHQWMTFFDDRIGPAHQAGTDALLAAGVPYGQSEHGVSDSPEKNAAAILQECGKVEAIVGVHCGLAPEDMFDVVDNPLFKAYTELMAVVPTVVTKQWTSREDLTDRERGEIRRLWGQEQQPDFLTSASSTSHMRPFLVGKKLHQEWLAHIQAPLQHTYACAIPNAAAIDAIESLRMPLMELGAGAGYWGALLRLRGIECVLYDRAPPTAQGNNPFFGRQYTNVLEGDESKAQLHPGHALMLVWPYSDEEAESGVPDSDPWDVRALLRYTGSTVVHVGEMDELAHNCTTSRSFKRQLTAAFTQVQGIALPSWPHCNDALTIWKRRSGANAA